jgi:6-phosphogluconolactonase (cycloisomerase 2 family)
MRNGLPAGGSHSKGIYFSRFKPAHGRTEKTGTGGGPSKPALAEAEAGADPRHFVFDAAGKFGYSLHEISGIVAVLAWNCSSGSFTKVQDTKTLASDFIGSSDSAEIATHPNGNFLYESNCRSCAVALWRPDSIGVFAIDTANGTLHLGPSRESCRVILP